jgi:Cellulose binding domain/GDSL-like Lipase/Acylhydrolase family
MSRLILRTFVSTVLLALAFFVALPVGAAQAAAIRIMPLGDSITGSPGCWRALLWQHLQTTGFTNIDMVGTQPAQGCAVPYDGDGEGHGGALVTAVADQNQLPGWLAATHPDIVLMHFGTNDVWSGRTPQQVLAAYSTLVDQMRASNPAMKVVVAQIIPLAPSGCADCPQRAVALNAAIPGWAAAKTTAQSPVTVVDQWTGFDPVTDTGDGVHPNDAGNQKMADRWYPALTAALSGTTPTDPPTGPPTDPPAAGACTASYRVVNAWQGAFQAEVTVTNTGRTAGTGWQVGFTFADGQVISQLWGGTPTQSGAAVAVRNVSWNGALAPAASTTFGFIASQNGPNPVPTTACTAT